MDDIQRYHEVILQQRTQIRHHKSIYQWMKRCWAAAPHADPNSMTLEEYQDTYSVLLYEMTICWEEELNDATVAKLWKRDTANFDTLNLDRFRCAIFYFVEMWVEEITMAEYDKIFAHVYRILSNLDLHVHNRDVSHATRVYRPPSQQQTFKPTLESFNSALDSDKAMDEQHVNFGKSISFDAQQYYRHFGTPTTHLQAFQATLLRAQSRVRAGGRCVEAWSKAHASHAPVCGPSTASSPEKKRSNRGDDGSPTTRDCGDTIRQRSAPQRPLSSSASGRARYVLEVDAGTTADSTPSHSPLHRHEQKSSPQARNREGFVLVGRTVLG